MKHQLSLDVPDTNNIKVFRLSDTSIYSEDLPVKCGYIQITSPGYSSPVNIETLPYFNLVLNACSLGIYQGGCGEDSPPLSDGIYTLRYSVSPNEKVYVEYNYLRITQTLNEYYRALSNLEMSSCEPTPDIKAKLKDLRLIRSFLDAAKAKVEYSNNPYQGIEIFEYAKKLLRKYLNGCY